MIEAVNCNRSMRRSNRQPIVMNRINDSERPPVSSDCEEYQTENATETGEEMAEEPKITRAFTNKSSFITV
jgi:hypothetical protein